MNDMFRVRGMHARDHEATISSTRNNFVPAHAVCGMKRPRLKAEIDSGSKYRKSELEIVLTRVAR